MNAPDPAPPPRLLLVVIDGLGSSAFTRLIANGTAPTLAHLIDCGATVTDVVSPFPSLTPVCLSTIATGTLPDQHRVPSLAWFHRGQHRFVEYGSSFAAANIEGLTRMIEDIVLDLNHVHLSEHTPTFFEVCQDAGLTVASINYLIFRGRTRHKMKHAYLQRVSRRTGAEAAYGPDHFYFGELFGTLKPLLPPMGVVHPTDWSGAQIARRLIRKEDVNFLLLYLGQHDTAAHRFGPEETDRAVSVADRQVGRVIEAAGGFEAFLSEWAIMVVADHGQTAIEPGQHAVLADAFPDLKVFRSSRIEPVDADIAIAPTNRFAMIYRLHDGAPSAGTLAATALTSPAVDIAAWQEDGAVSVATNRGLLAARRTDDGWRITGNPAALDLVVDGDGEVIGYGSYPDALTRLAASLACVNSGDVLISARVGWNFVDLGGRFHVGGSHGSLHERDSLAPLLTLGLAGVVPTDDEAVALGDVFTMVTSHFGLAPSGLL